MGRHRAQPLARTGIPDDAVLRARRYDVSTLGQGHPPDTDEAIIALTTHTSHRQRDLALDFTCFAGLSFVQSTIKGTRLKFIDKPAGRSIIRATKGRRERENE